MEAGGSGKSPGHGGSVVGQSEAAVWTEEDDAAMAAETVEKVSDGLAGGELRSSSSSHPVCGPLAENELHDGFAPAGEGDGGGEVVGVAAATDEGGVADTAGSLVEGATGRSGGGEVSAGVESYSADGVMRIETSGLGSRPFLPHEVRLARRRTLIA